MLVVANKGVMPIELSGSEPYFGSAMRRVPLMRNGSQITRNLCAFHKKENDTPAIREFEQLLIECFK